MQINERVKYRALINLLSDPDLLDFMAEKEGQGKEEEITVPIKAIDPPAEDHKPSTEKDTSVLEKDRSIAEKDIAISRPEKETETPIKDPIQEQVLEEIKTETPEVLPEIKVLSIDHALHNLEDYLLPRLHSGSLRVAPTTSFEKIVEDLRKNFSFENGAVDCQKFRSEEGLEYLQSVLQKPSQALVISKLDGAEVSGSIAPENLIGALKAEIRDKEFSLFHHKNGLVEIKGYYMGMFIDDPYGYIMIGDQAYTYLANRSNGNVSGAMFSPSLPRDMYTDDAITLSGFPSSTLRGDMKNLGSYSSMGISFQKGQETYDLQAPADYQRMFQESPDQTVRVAGLEGVRVFNMMPTPYLTTADRPKIIINYANSYSIDPPHQSIDHDEASHLVDQISICLL